MSFAAIDPKFLIVINNYTSYDERKFWNYVRNLGIK